MLMAIPLSAATAVIQVLTLWLSFLLVLLQPEPRQGHSVPANPRGDRKSRNHLSIKEFEKNEKSIDRR